MSVADNGGITVTKISVTRLTRNAQKQCSHPGTLVPELSVSAARSLQAPEKVAPVLNLRRRACP